MVIAAAVAPLSCVPSVPHFTTHAEARAGHPAENAEYGAVETWVEPVAAPLQAPPTRGASPRAPRAGYWHWDGTRFVKVPADWEDESPAYLWSWKTSSAER